MKQEREGIRLLCEEMFLIVCTQTSQQSLRHATQKLCHSPLSPHCSSRRLCARLAHSIAAFVIAKLKLYDMKRVRSRYVYLQELSVSQEWFFFLYCSLCSFPAALQLSFTLTPESWCLYHIYHPGHCIFDGLCIIKEAGLSRSRIRYIVLPLFVRLVWADRHRHSAWNCCRRSYLARTESLCMN